MKKAVFLLAFIITVSSGFSQQRKRVHQENQMNPEQRTTLAVKKLTLALGLDENQAEKATTLFTEMSKKRKVKGQLVRKEGMMKRKKMMEMRKSSKDGADFKKKVGKAIEEGELEKEDVAKMRGRRKGSNFDAQNNALDHMISMQSEMKKILTKEQFATYKKIQKHRMKKQKKTMRVKRSR